MEQAMNEFSGYYQPFLNIFSDYESELLRFVFTIAKNGFSEKNCSRGNLSETCSPLITQRTINDFANLYLAQDAVFISISSLFLMVFLLLSLYLVFCLHHVSKSDQIHDSKLAKVSSTSTLFTIFGSQCALDDPSFPRNGLPPLGSFRDDSSISMKTWSQTNNILQPIFLCLFCILFLVSLIVYLVFAMTLINYLVTNDVSNVTLLRNGTENGLHMALLNVGNKFNNILDIALQSGNDSLIGVFETKFPLIQNFFSNFTKDVLSELYRSYSLRGLFDSLDLFIYRIEGSTYINNAIKDASSKLYSLESSVEATSENLLKLFHKLCNSSHDSSTVLSCRYIIRDLSDLHLNMDTKILRADGITTVITFLRQSGFNITKTKVEKTQAEASINKNVEVINDEVAKILSQVSKSISDEFDNAKASVAPIKQFILDTQYSKSSLYVISSFQAGVVAITAGITLVTLLCFVFQIYVFVTLYRNMIKFTRVVTYMSKFSLEYAFARGCIINSHSSPSTSTHGTHLECCPRTSVRKKKPRSRSSIVVMKESMAQRCATVSESELLVVIVRFKKLMSRLAFVYLAIFLLLFIFIGSALCLFYIGCSIQNKFCHYFLTSEGRTNLDNHLNELMNLHIWPILKNTFENQINLPIPFSFQQSPTNILSSVFDKCSSKNASLFFALNMMNVLNVSAFIYSPTVRNNIDIGKGMVHNAIKTLKPEEIVSPDILMLGKSPMVRSLSLIADAEIHNSARNLELRKSIFNSDMVFITKSVFDSSASLKAIRGFGDNVKYAEDFIMLTYFSQHMNNILINQHIPLSELISNISSTIDAMKIPSTVATIDMLDKYTDSLVLTLKNLEAMKTTADEVFDRLVSDYLPLMVKLLEPMQPEILLQMIPCQSLYSLVKISSDAVCSELLQFIVYYFFSIILCLLVLILFSFYTVGLSIYLLNVQNRHLQFCMY